MLRWIRPARRGLLDYGFGYALWALGGLGIVIEIQMSVWPLVVIGLLMVLFGFWLVGV